MSYFFSLRNAWWLYWMRDDAIRDLVMEVFLEQWTGKLQRILDERHLTRPQLDDRMLWEEYTQRRLLQGAFTTKGGLPLMYIYSMTTGLQVKRDDLLPGDQELYVEATHRFCPRLVPLVELSRPMCQAYVEYHLHQPAFRPGVLDAAAAQRAFDALPGLFADPGQLAEAIKQAARAIDRYLVTIS